MAENKTKITNLFDFKSGLINRAWNPLLFPEDAVTYGKDVTLEYGDVRTRKPSYYSHLYANSASPMPEGTTGTQPVTMLKQVRMASTGQYYTLAYSYGPSGGGLYASTSEWPIVDGSSEWTILYLDATWEPIATPNVALLADRVVIAGGVPLVWAGGLAADDDGSDWATPKAVLVSWDGTNADNLTADVCNTDDNNGVAIPITTSGYLYVCFDMPLIDAVWFELGDGNETAPCAMTAEYYTGSAWTAGSGFTDNTLYSTISMYRSGSVSYDSTAPDSAYQLLWGVAGYWWRFSWSANLHANTQLNRVKFTAPAQPLKVLGDGQPDACDCFLFNNTSTGALGEYTPEVIDATELTYAPLYDEENPTTTIMGSGDYIYVCNAIPFYGVTLTPSPDHQNTNTATMSAWYWNGSSWGSLPITDGTSVSSVTLNREGQIIWTVPSDWKMTSPEGGLYPRGYWVRLGPNATLSPNPRISECQVYPTYEALPAYRFAVRWKDRIVIASSAAAEDQINISPAYLEYSMGVGEDSYTTRLGGQDRIVAMMAFGSDLLIWQGNGECYKITGTKPTDYYIDRSELGQDGMAPVSNDCLVKAYYPDKIENKTGVYWISGSGAWCYTGSSTYPLSENVTYWDADADVHIQLDAISTSKGAWVAAKNWVVWAVPLSDASQTTPTHPNGLIVYDVAHQRWLPHVRLPTGADLAGPHIRSLAHVYETSSNLPGGSRLLAGCMQGRVIDMLLGDTVGGEGAEVVETSGITGVYSTGWLSFGNPEWIKVLDALRVWAWTNVASNISIKVYYKTTSATKTFPGTGFQVSEGLYAVDWQKQNIHATAFKLEITILEDTIIHGTQCEWHPERMYYG